MVGLSQTLARVANGCRRRHGSDVGETRLDGVAHHEAPRVILRVSVLIEPIGDAQAAVVVPGEDVGRGHQVGLPVVRLDPRLKPI